MLERGAVGERPAVGKHECGLFIQRELDKPRYDLGRNHLLDIVVW
jgi:hypothetical protein